MRHSGVLIQFDQAEARLSPADRMRAAVAACEAAHGWRAVQVLVHRNGYEWPEEIDGVRVIPSATIAYPSWMMVVKPVTEESHVTANVG